MDDPVSVKGGKSTVQKKRSKKRVHEDTLAKPKVECPPKEREDGESKAKEQKFTYKPNESFNPHADYDYMKSRMCERMSFCRRTQLQWHIQRVVTNIINQMCLGCKNNCLTDHTICNRSPAYILSTYPESCARQLLAMNESGVPMCDVEFLQHLREYDVNRVSAIRLPSSILVSYFATMFPDGNWCTEVLKPILAWKVYGFPPPRFDMCNSKEVMHEVLLGVLTFSPSFSFFFK